MLQEKFGIGFYYAENKKQGGYLKMLIGIAV